MEEGGTERGERWEEGKEGGQESCGFQAEALSG